MDDIILVLTNLPDRDSALRMADTLIECRAAGCVSVMAECSSVYRWQGKIERASEIPLLIKSTATAYPRLETTIREHHPYELPEILVVSANAGFVPYMRWLCRETEDRGQRTEL